MSLQRIRRIQLSLTVLVLLGGRAWSADEPQPQLAHIVFFRLKERAPEARQRLVDACRRYLSGHRGTVYFSAGVIAEDLDRDVNDRDFDVALHLVFRNRAAHDRYQTHERHKAFIESEKETWDSVLVFNSYVQPPRDREADRESPSERERDRPRARDRDREGDRTREGDRRPDRPGEGDRTREGERDRDPPRRIPLPDPASLFAGMVRGEIVEKRRGAFVLLVDEVAREWKHSKAADSGSLEGKKVLVNGPGEDAANAQSIGRFIRLVRVGEKVTLDVAHRRGEALTILELSTDQRERVRTRD